MGSIIFVVRLFIIYLILCYSKDGAIVGIQTSFKPQDVISKFDLTSFRWSRNDFLYFPGRADRFNKKSEAIGDKTS